MYTFRYHKPSSLDQARELLRSAEDGTLLAGGQTLIPSLKQRLAAPSDIIDLSGVPGMSGVSVEGDHIVIGAATSHAAVAASADLSRILPAAVHVASHIGDPHVRHMGTIGGSIANNDPSADYPALCLALGATIETTHGKHHADDFFAGLFETCLQDDEIILRVSLPIPQCCAYQKFPNPASRYAMVGVCVARMTSGSVHVAVTGAGNGGVFRHSALEAALGQNFSPNAASAITDESTLIGDIHGSTAYRAHLINVMSQRAVADCLAA